LNLLSILLRIILLIVHSQLLNYRKNIQKKYLKLLIHFTMIITSIVLMNYVHIHNSKLHKSVDQIILITYNLKLNWQKKTLGNMLNYTIKITSF
jgi:hypothetical protein